MSANAVPDVMSALSKLQAALDAKIVTLTRCDLHPELGLLVDQPDGRLRFTFALTEDGKVVSIASFVVLAGRVEGLPCLHAGYAVIESRRNAGIGSRTLENAIDELRNGLCRQNLGPFYLEALVAAQDDASNRIARKLLSSSPLSTTDNVGRETILQYFRRVDCGASESAS